jgi:hypothetical protein
MTRQAARGCSCSAPNIRPSGSERAILKTDHRAAFEILTDDRDHGIPISI